MADIHDLQNAGQETDDALRSIREFAAPIAEALADEQFASEDRRVALAILTVGEAIVLAIRELGVRADYVIRNANERPGSY